MSDERIQELCDLFTRIAKALVKDSDAVWIEPVRTETTVILHLRVSLKDRGKVLGKGGRIARSMRIILHGIAREQGESYQLTVEGRSPDELS